MKAPKPDYLPTLKELIMFRDFPDERMCVQMVVTKLWGREPMCPECQRGKLSLRLIGTSWQMFCTQQYKCHYHLSPFAGTMFVRSHKPLTTWFAAIDIIFCTNGLVEPSAIAKKLGIGIGAATSMRKKILAGLGLPDKKQDRSLKNL